LTLYEKEIEVPPSEDEQEEAIPPRRKFLFTTLTLLLVAVVCLVGLEAGLRVYCLVKPNADVEFFRYANLMKANVNGSRVVFMHQPNMKLHLMGVDVETNSRGFREVEYAARKEPGTKRIGLLGDSITFGWGVPYGQRFSEIIENRWNTPGSAPVALINTGHGNYNSTQEDAMLEDYLSADDLDGVIQIWYINDAEPLPVHRDAPWYSHSYAYIFLWSKYDLMVRRAGNRKNYVDYYRDLYKEGSPGLPEFKQALQRTGDWTRRHNVPWIFVVLPEFHNFDDNNPFSDIYDEVKRTAASAGAVVVDVTGDFKGQDPASIWVSYNDVHPNAKGHAIIAEGILKRVDPTIFVRQPSGR